MCELQRTLDACERELAWLDMAIYTKSPAVFGLAREMITFVLTLQPAKVTIWHTLAFIFIIVFIFVLFIIYFVFLCTNYILNK